MARGDVRVINNSASVTNGVTTDIDVSCNSNEMMQVTPGGSGQVTVQAHTIEV